MACRDMLKAGLNCVEYKNGARHTLSDYADMAIKTANKRAYLMGEGEKRKEFGITTVVINSRQGGCSKCSEYIGKVYIDDVYSGGSADDGNYPLLSEAIKSGLFHPRCKDSTSTYIEGITQLDNPVTAKEKAEMEHIEKLEAKQNYYENQAEKCQRIADYSLDKENKQIYQHRVDVWEEKAEESQNRLLDFTEMQNYKPVELSDDVTTGERRGLEVLYRKVENATNEIYTSKSVNLKKRDLHKLDGGLSRCYGLIKPESNYIKPRINVVSNAEMRSLALASYSPKTNELFVSETLIKATRNKFATIQAGYVCPNSEISTLLHELIHWQDAEKYRKNIGAISDFNSYIDYLNKKFAPMLEKIQKEGYNINGISRYAKDKFIAGRFDEVFTEYRVKQLLSG